MIHSVYGTLPGAGGFVMSFIEAVRVISSFSSVGFTFSPADKDWICGIGISFQSPENSSRVAN